VERVYTEVELKVAERQLGNQESFRNRQQPAGSYPFIRAAEGVATIFPSIDWLPHYKSEWLRFDIIAATLCPWALLVPQGHCAIRPLPGVPAPIRLYANAGLAAWLSHWMMVSPFTLLRRGSNHSL
jgi:hypothetical protein